VRKLRTEHQVHFTRGRQSRKVLQNGPRPNEETPTGRIPRISRLMALAIRFERLIQAGHVTDQAELARLGHVTRARVTQIMNLLNLAPDIQEDILFLPRTKRGTDPVREIMVRPIAATPDWRKQRNQWRVQCELLISGRTDNSVPSRTPPPSPTDSPEVAACLGPCRIASHRFSTDGSRL